MNSLQKYDETVKNLREIFERKNKAYGNSFLSASKPAMFLEVMRKACRLRALFDEDDNVLRYNGKDKEPLEETLLDLANYVIMFLITLERKSPCFGIGEGEINRTISSKEIDEEINETRCILNDEGENGF